MKLSAKVVTGVLNTSNKSACDWGWQGQLAHGCHNCVVVIDPVSVQVIQVLNKHKSSVVKVKWARENYHHDTGSPYTLRLASGDSNGSIIIWDVGQGEAKTEFSDGNKPIQGLEWLPWQDASHDLLVALHPPYSLILWNADTGTKLWKKSYTENLTAFSLDPFNYRNIAFLGQDCIVFIDDFSVTKTPSSNGKKFYISSPSSGSNKGDTSVGSLERKSSTSSSRNLAKRMTRILVGEGKERGEDERSSMNECIQLSYHESCRHHLILVYPREILILDLEINQTVGIIPSERTGSPFIEVVPMRQRDVLYCLHENGSITCRVRRKTNMQATPSSEGNGAFDDTLPSVSQDVTYDLRCQSDSIRMTRHCRVAGVMCNPVSEKTLALLLSDSRVVMWDLHTVDLKGLSLDDEAEPVPYPRLTLSDMIGPPQDSGGKGQGTILRFLMTGLISGITSPITVIRMCPPLTTKNWNLYEPLLAIGNQTGSVQIINLGSGQIDREYSLHTSSVRGIEWASLKSFLSFTHPKPGVSGLVKNEILLVDISSGRVTHLRTQRDQESPIEMLRVSHLKQYFIVTFKDKPLELWDLKSMTMLREMSKSLPIPTALEWSPSHSLKALRKKMQMQIQQQQQQQSDQQQKLNQSGAGNTSMNQSTDGNDTTLMSDTSMNISMSASMTENTTGEQKLSSAKLSVKEHFVYTDNDGTLYHFIVEGSGFTDASKIPPESGMASVTWVAWKGDFLAFGDGDGQLCLWDLKNKTSRTNSTHRGWIKKIRFAPGRGNFKFLILYNDGIDLWDINEGKPELLSSLKSPKEISKVLDAEWSGSDRPVVATQDGCVHMFDLSLKRSGCGIEDRELHEPELLNSLKSPKEISKVLDAEWSGSDRPVVATQDGCVHMFDLSLKRSGCGIEDRELHEMFTPYLMPSKASLLMKYMLQHQKWADNYSLKLTGMREEDKDVENLINKNMDLIDKDLTDYLPHCKFGTAQRCLLAARLFGDESEVNFWTVALHYMRAGRMQGISKSSSCVFTRQQSGDLFIPKTPSHKEAHDLVNLSPDTDQDQTGMKKTADLPLETCYDFLCDNISFKKYQLDRVSLHDCKRATYEHTKKCAENYIMLGQTDRAVQLLLETDPDNENYYTDCLRSCLVASIRSSGASQSTIKLVATNLIASGKLLEGVQLLCLIDKGLDACRYLETYGAWEQAVWLAKCSLEYTECCEVLKRWVEHLNSTHVNRKSTAVLVMLSLGYFNKVIEMLYGMRQFNRAVCFIEAAMEFKLLEKTQDNEALIEAVYLEYARQLSNLGHKQSAMYYCKQAGEKGNQLLKEVEILFP